MFNKLFESTQKVSETGGDVMMSDRAKRESTDDSPDTEEVDEGSAEVATDSTEESGKLTAYFEHGFSIDMTAEDAESVSHPGPCDTDVAALVSKDYIVKQLDAIDPDSIRKELKRYGAWDEEELADDEKNRERIVWVAGGNIIEEGIRVADEESGEESEEGGEGEGEETEKENG
jgi:hypothetical protein